MGIDDKNDNPLFDVIGPSFLKRFKSGERKVISYVKDVEDTPNGLVAHTTNVHGEPNIKFLSKKEEEIYIVGEYIENTVSGQRVISSRKLNLNQPDKEELAKKFKSIGEDG